MRLLLPLVIALLLPSATLAAPASRESVEALFTETDMAATWDASISHLLDSAEQTVAARQAREPDPTPRRVRVDAAMARIRQLLRSVDMSWASIRPEMVQAYVDAYSQEDIDATLAFHRSAAGRALRAKGASLKAMPGQPGSGLDDRHLFTQEESDGILAYFRSPTARAMQAATQQVGAHLRQIAAARLEAVMPQIRQINLDVEAANAADKSPR